MKFPRRKNDIVALTLEVLNGLSANSGDFPDPPFAAVELDSAYSDMKLAMSSRQAKEAELAIAIADERDRFTNLKAELRRILDLAEAYHESARKAIAYRLGPESQSRIESAGSAGRAVSYTIIFGRCASGLAFGSA